MTGVVYYTTYTIYFICSSKTNLVFSPHLSRMHLIMHFFHFVIATNESLMIFLLMHFVALTHFPLICVIICCLRSLDCNRTAAITECHDCHM